jgi:hypothetical protein
MTSPGQLTLHADRGGPMKAKPTALLLADLGLTRSHNRPYTSTTTHSRKSLQDLKVSAALTPTLRLHRGCQELSPTLPRLVQPGTSSCCDRSDDPGQVHYGQTHPVYAVRQHTLDRAFRENPARFVNKAPTPPAKPCRPPRGAGGWTGGRATADQLLYLNSGRAFRASFVPPGRTIFLSTIFRAVNGTTTYFVPIPRKPPTDSTA